MDPVRWSNLEYMADAPAVYRYRLENGVTVSTAMRFGSLVHAIVLGTVTDGFVKYDGQRRGNDWAEFKALHGSQEIVTADEWDRAMECAAAVLSDPICGPLVKSGIKEHRLWWNVGPRTCAGTPDVHGNILLDLKVTQMANPLRIAWHVRKMMWHAQLAWYKHGIEANGGTVKDVYLVAVTPKPPYMAVAYILKPETIEFGTKQWRALFERLLVCEDSGQWPGYAQEILPLGIDDDEGVTLTIDGEEWNL